MTSADILKTLEALGSEQTRKVLTRHGAREPFFGVKTEDLKKIVKSVKKIEKDKDDRDGKELTDSHHLALELYATGNSDAMYLAGLMADPKRMDRATLQTWVDEAYWHMLSDYAVAWVTAESRFGWELGLEWIRSEREMTASAGWAALGGVVAITPDSQLNIPIIKALMEQIGKTIHTAPNRVRYSMNSFLIAASSYIPELTTLGKSIALSIGKVSVNMGETSCKVPFAPDYISKIDKMGRIGVKRKTVVC